MRRIRGVRAAVGAAAIAAAVVFVLLAAHSGRPRPFALVAAAFVGGAGGAAAAAAFVRAWRARDLRLPWLAVGVACALEAGQRAAELRGWYITSANLPVLHLAAAIVATVGVSGLRAPAPDRAASRRTLLDAATMVCAVALVTGNAVLAPAQGERISTATLVSAFAVAAADVALAVAGLLILSRARYPGGASLRALLPICAGVVSLAAGDAGLSGLRLAGDATVNGPGQLFLGSGLVLILAAAMTQDADDSAVMPRRERVAVCASVGPVVLAALAVSVYQVTEHRLPALLAGGVMLLSGLLLARLIVASLDNLVLSRTLESQVAERTLEIVTREQWFRSLVQHSSDVVTVIDPSGIVRYQSPASERLFGHDPAVMVGQPVSGLLQPADAARLQAAMARAADMPGASFVLEFPMAHRDGSWRDTETVITSLIDVPDVRGLVLNTRDVTDRKQLAERLAHQAYHDELTGLANRALFQERLAAALASPAAVQVAVLFCDLDGFKAVNDSQGHDVGDALLGLVAQRLMYCVRADDLVARFGGDEFAVLVTDTDGLRAAREVAERIEESLRRPFALDDRELRVGVSIGIALADPDADSVDLLLRNADLAMYRAKAEQNLAVVVFERAMHDALLARLKVEDDLRAALGGGELVLHYQPTVELATGRPVGVEALMRWYRPGCGIVPPQEFIGVAEENGFIEAMGQWALFEACRQGAAWQRFAAPGTAFSVGVNISARQVSPSLVDVVAAALAESSLPPAALLLEMTESVLLGRTEEAVDVLRALKRLGVRIAIDDFGTGFSSLSYLARFPVDVLKIDKGFIDDSPNGSELARTIVQLGASLRLATVAEGIETSVQRQALVEMGCGFGQGFLFGRPMPANGVTMLLTPHGIGAVPAQRSPHSESAESAAELLGA
ncbi:MAG: EAL domain-containing protein [Frankiaceae bacterium]|nr:EAL domain-containing protein [Frankiaceae bacterium]